jgi:hypothetical protein
MSARLTEIVKRRHALMGCFCLLLLALLGWRLAEGGFNPSRIFRAGDAVDSTSLLDSFSEPSVGLAVVKREAERLMINYTQNRDEVEMHQLAQLPQLSYSAAVGTSLAPGSVESWPAAVKNAAAREAFALKQLAKLRAEVQDLELDLELKLMTAYSYRESCNELLDCYLRLVQQAPERPWVQWWRQSALECARKCGREEELADALRHVIQFQEGLYGAGEMRTVLEEWEPDNFPLPEVSKR